MAKANRGISLGASALVVIAIIAIVGFGAFVAGNLSATTTVPNYATDYITTTTGGAASPNSVSTGGMTTSLALTEQMSSSVSPSGLRLDLIIAPSNGSLGSEVFMVNEYNTLSSVNNVTLANDWQYPQSSLNPYSPCGLVGAVGLAVFQGYYDLSNFTKATALSLYDTSAIYLCTTTISEPNTYYSFQPQSDQAGINSPPGTFVSINTTLSLSFTTKGYWTGGFDSGTAPAFHNFPVITTLCLRQMNGARL